MGKAWRKRHEVQAWQWTRGGEMIDGVFLPPDDFYEWSFEHPPGGENRCMHCGDRVEEHAVVTNIGDDGSRVSICVGQWLVWGDGYQVLSDSEFRRDYENGSAGGPDG